MQPAADPVSLQRAFYARTAAEYDGMHDALEHDRALGHIIGFIRWLAARSMLDTGCGTGRAMRAVRSALPDIEVRGNDPSPELLDVAARKFGLPPDSLDCADSRALPYASGSFDVVVATGIMHHVADPATIIENMLRVARLAVFVSDCNMYGQGSVGARVSKLVLSRTGLLRSVNRRRRQGNDWIYMEGDGVAWNYSVFDSLAQVGEQCQEVLMIPTTGGRDARSPVTPRLRCSHALLCGFKTPLPRVAV